MKLAGVKLQISSKSIKGRKPDLHINKAVNPIKRYERFHVVYATSEVGKKDTYCPTKFVDD